MTIRNSFTKLFVLVALVVLVALLSTQPERAQAIDDPDEKPSPMAGMAKGQTARLNVVNIGNPTISPCDVSLTFFDSKGAVLAKDAQVLKPGEAAYLDLKRDAIKDSNSRVQIRALVQVASTECLTQVLTSLEVYDTDTGRTTVFIGDPSIKQ